MKTFKMTGEKVVNLCLLLLSASYLAYSLSNYQLGTVRSPREGLMPAILGAGAVLICAVLTLQAFLGKGDAQNVRFNISWLRFFLLIAVSVAYALLLTYLGYPLSTFLFLLGVLKIVKVNGWIKPLLIALMTAAVFYGVFKFALGVLLPSGILGL